MQFSLLDLLNFADFSHSLENDFVPVMATFFSCLSSKQKKKKKELWLYVPQVWDIISVILNTV